MADSLRLLHISDFHFSSGMHKAEPRHCHSIQYLQALSNSIRNQYFDRVVVTGDLSNLGDRQSLLNAYGYLFDRVAIGEGEKLGLELDEDRTFVLPGNHDAFNNMEAHGRASNRWQRSIEFYNSVFVNHTVPPEGCRYYWIEAADCPVYLAVADTCFLGDPELDARLPDISPLGSIAKGKLSLSQSEKLLQWYDLGIRGKLPHPDREGEYIDSSAFASSLKVLATHHYLFEPQHCRNARLLQVEHRDDVFRNIAMADFDVVLCGHKHVQDFGKHTYGFHLERRGKKRYLMNYFRRLVGINSLPVQFREPQSGRFYSKYFTLMANLVMKSLKRDRRERGEGDGDGEYLENLVDILRGGLQDPDRFRTEMRRIAEEEIGTGVDTLSDEEVHEVQRVIASNFTREEKKALANQALKMKSLVRRLNSRPFVQAMSGSSGKACKDPSTRRRSYAIHHIRRADAGYRFESEIYYWNEADGVFEAVPERNGYDFRADRQPHWVSN